MSGFTDLRDLGVVFRPFDSEPPPEWLRSDLDLVARIFSWLSPAARKQLGRFLSHVRFDDSGCWLWTGTFTANGYGRFYADGRNQQAHRWLYERLVGTIPEGLVLDHVLARGCRHRHCVNPAHLEAVTNAENVSRGMTAAKTECPQGHEYTNANTRYYRGRRYCRACNNNGGRGRQGKLQQARDLVGAPS